MKGTGFLGAALVGAMSLMASPAVSAQDAAASRASAYSDIASWPDWSGVWETDWSTLFGGTPAQPQLTPAAQEKVDAFRKQQESEGVDQYAQIHCIPPGMPGIMRQPYPIEFIYSPDRVTLFAETYSQARRIYLDGRPLPDDPDLLFNGTSVGHWDGDTLVVDTVGFSPLTNITAGLPHSDKSRIHERIWLEKPNKMVIETTITDPVNLAEPWTTRQAYNRQPDWEIREYVCAENNRLTQGEHGANIDLEFDPDDPFAPPPGEED